MSGITEEFGRIAEASESPTLGLLRLKWAPFVLAVFRQVFDQASKTITTDRLHVRVGVYLEEMAAAGHEVPTGDGRALCTQWMHNRWLNRIHDENGDEAYELTSAALGAQRVVENLARDRALLSESRLVTIIDGVRRLAVDANPDRDSRIAALDAQIRSLQAERDYLQAGGHIEAAPDDRMLEGYLDMRDLLGQLPRDFRRVEETLDIMRRDLVKEFRADERPKGDVLEEYLERSERLSTQTEEGRAFEGALAILSDVPLLREFQDGLARILDHPFADSLRPDEADEFRRSANLLRRGLRDVQTTRTRLHRSLSDFITSHDSASEREVTRTLNALQEEMAVWMESARIRDGVPMPGDMPEKLQFEHLKTRFWDPADHRQVAELEDVTDTVPEALGLDDVRAQGGPLLGEIRAAMALAVSAGAQTLGDAFSTLPDDLRRPVELFGLMHLTADAERDDTVEAVVAHRPDGTTRTLLIPRMSAAALVGDAAPTPATVGEPIEEDTA